MARVAVELTNFTGGELSPRLDGRTDLTKYSSGCSTLQNLVVYPHGSAARRPGSTFVAEVADSDNKTRLIPFEFSTTQTYMLEFSNLKMRVYKDKGAVLEGDKTITGITQANPAVVTASSHGYSNGDEVLISGVSGMTEVNNKRFLVADKTTNTFELQDKDCVDINSTSFTAYASGGVSNKVFELATPYTTAQLFDLKFAQSADVMYITHPNHAARKLSRTGHTSWTLTEIDFTDGPYLSQNTTSTTLTPSGTTGSVNITASASTFAATDVGRLVSFSNGRAKITGFTSATVVAATVQDNFDNTNAVTTWKLGAFSGTTGHPSCVSFFEQRLVFAVTTNEPQTLYFSKSGDYENMTAGTNADDSEWIVLEQNEWSYVGFHPHDGLEGLTDDGGDDGGSSGLEICDDGIDNDGDGYVDCYQ